MDETTEIRSMTKKELAALFNVSLYTLKKWLKPIEADLGEVRGRTYTPKQVETILNHLT